MDPITAYTLAKTRISERQAEAAANRLAAQSRKADAESPCRAEAAGRRPRLAAPQIDCSWIERFWAFIRRALQVRPA
ncbi:MAG: hypothetical protein ABSC46_08880 [Candidatus Limnocylindrales bacterium]|jgi:hypothetical protein